MNKILITGGAGFIGSNFCNIQKNNYEMIALDNLFLGDSKNLEEGVRFIEGDASNISDLNKAGKVDYVIHLAGTSSAPMFHNDSIVDAYVNSVQSFITVLEWSRKNNVNARFHETGTYI